MIARRVLAILIVLAGVASLAWGVSSWRRAGVSLAEVDGRQAASQAELDSTRAELKKTGLLYRGFLNSMSAVPDTLRMYGGGIIMKQRWSYEKALSQLEGREHELVRDLGKLDRERAEIRAQRRQSTLPGAAVGAALLAVGVVLWRRGRPRPVAA